MATNAPRTSKRPSLVILLLAAGALSAYLVVGGHVYTMTSGSDIGFFLTMGMMLFSGMTVFVALWLSVGAVLGKPRAEIHLVGRAEGKKPDEVLKKAA